MAQRKVAVKKAAPANKRGPKAKPVEEEKPQNEVEDSAEESDESDEKSAVNFDDGSDSEPENGKDFVESEAEESDDDDDEDVEEDDNDEPEPGEVKKSAESDDDDDDSDEEPVEAPIAKKNKKTAQETKPEKVGIPKVSIGRIPHDTPKNQTIFITELPKVYKHVDLIALLTKFGPIAVVNRVKTKAGGNNVIVAFESPEAAKAAVDAGKLTLADATLKVSYVYDKSELNKRTIVVGLVGPQATKESITAHFKSCGSIESVNFSNNRALPTAFVRFESIDSIPKSLKLHGSQLDSRFITVREETYKAQALKSPKCTVTISNTGNHESYKSDAIEKIFKKHGEIVDIDVVCTRGILGFVTYKTAEQAEKALKQLNGKTVGDLELKLSTYELSSSARTTLVVNLATGVTEEELNTLFSDCGEVESIKMLPSKALIRFTTDDGFCKSFLLNEHLVHGQPIFLEPNSILKYKLFRSKVGQNTSNYNKRPADGAAGKPFNKYNNNNNNKRPFNNKRPAQNGSKPHFNKKPRTA